MVIGWDFPPQGYTKASGLLMKDMQPYNIYNNLIKFSNSFRSWGIMCPQRLPIIGFKFLRFVKIYGLLYADYLNKVAASTPG